MKWISVKDRLPEDNKYSILTTLHVLVCNIKDKNSDPFIASYIDGIFREKEGKPYGRALEITHWIPLPEMPNDEV